MLHTGSDFIHVDSLVVIMQTHTKKGTMYTDMNEQSLFKLYVLFSSQVTNASQLLI